MLLQLDSCAPVVTSIDWTWFLLYVDRCVHSKSYVINLIYHRWTPIKLWKHLKDDQWKQDAPELNLSLIAKGLNTYVNIKKYFCFCIHLQKISKNLFFSFVIMGNCV